MVVGEVGYDWGGWIGFLTLSFLNFVAREQQRLAVIFLFFFLGGIFFLGRILFLENNI